jgi:hypothetical protein
MERISSGAEQAHQVSAHTGSENFTIVEAIVASQEGVMESMRNIKGTVYHGTQNWTTSRFVDAQYKIT